MYCLPQMCYTVLLRGINAPKLLEFKISDFQIQQYTRFNAACVSSAKVYYEHAVQACSQFLSVQFFLFLSRHKSKIETYCRQIHKIRDESIVRNVKSLILRGAQYLNLYYRSLKPKTKSHKRENRIQKPKFKKKT